MVAFRRKQVHGMKKLPKFRSDKATYAFLGISLRIRKPVGAGLAKQIRTRFSVVRFPDRG